MVLDSQGGALTGGSCKEEVDFWETALMRLVFMKEFSIKDLLSGFLRGNNDSFLERAGSLRSSSL